MWEPSPPAQRGCAAPSSHGAGPEVSPGRPSVRLSSLALTPARSVRERRERPRASPLTVPAVCTAVSLSAFHCVLSAFREFTHFPFLYSCFFYPAITGQEGKSPFRLVFLRAVVPQCARRARPSEGRGVTCSSEGRCARCYQRKGRSRRHWSYLPAFSLKLPCTTDVAIDVHAQQHVVVLGS